MKSIAIIGQAGATLTDDDRMLIDAIVDAGGDAVSVGWDDPAVDWESFGTFVLRSCWNYHRFPGAFDRWLRRLETTAAPVLNPLPLIRWNLDKAYLLELARHAPVVPTIRVDRDERRTIAEIAKDQGWERVVVKPSMSASSFATFRIDEPGSEQAEPIWRDVRAIGPTLVQPYLPTIETKGEISLCYIAGTFSHAVVKQPKSGDFRVQTQHGGSITPIRPDDALIALGARILARLPQLPVFARVDLVDGADGPMLMEFELIEPQLFFPFAPHAATVAARAVLAASLADPVF